MFFLNFIMQKDYFDFGYISWYCIRFQVSFINVIFDCWLKINFFDGLIKYRFSYKYNRRFLGILNEDMFIL